MNTPAQSSIHVHDVMSVLSQSPLTRDQLFQLMSEKTGTDPRFHACSQQDMNLDEMLVFLQQRQKIIDVAGTFHFSGQSCSH